MTAAVAAFLRRLWPRRVRTRLALLYAVLFLVAGSGLLALTYALLSSRLPNPAATTKSVAVRDRQLATICKQRAQAALASSSPLQKQPGQPGLASPSLLQKCKLAFAAGARAGSSDQRDRTLSTLLDASLIGLGVATLASAGLGWLVSRRVLNPVRSITETARRASELQLGERLALAGPEDELKELADTFDAMLERLDTAFASQKRFVANAAHELRTPLTAMHTAVEVTLTKPARTQEQLEAMAIRVKRSIDRAEATIEALLALATSELPPRAEESVDLATAAQEALDTLSSAIAKRGLTVEAALEPATAVGERVLVERMIANLVENAVRHNTPDGWIRMRTLQQADSAVFEIANTGPYVAEKLIPTLFEPFARAQERVNHDNGVGLGLSIAKAIAQAHGATITAHSRPEGGLELIVVI